MTHPDRSRLERVVTGPDYPEVRERSGMVVVYLAAVLVIAVLAIYAAASQSARERSPVPEPTGAPSAGSGLLSTGGVKPSGYSSGSVEWPRKSSSSASPRGAETAGGGAPPTVDRYRGLATWYCLSGSSACTRGYSGSDLVAAIDTDLGFVKGDQLVVRYRDRAVTVTVVDVCRCPGERLIDLTSGAFARLAPLGLGVIPVTVELAGGPTLPPTESLP